jgi:hypothetical protein
VTDLTSIPNYDRYIALDAAVTTFELEEQKTREGAEKKRKIEQATATATNKVAALPEASSVTDLPTAKRQLDEANTAIGNARIAGMPQDNEYTLKNDPKYIALQDKVRELEKTAATQQEAQAKEQAKQNIALAF